MTLLSCCPVAMYPESSEVLGYCRGEPVYSRNSVHTVSEWVGDTPNSSYGHSKLDAKTVLFYARLESLVFSFESFFTSHKALIKTHHSKALTKNY